MRHLCSLEADPLLLLLLQHFDFGAGEMGKRKKKKENAVMRAFCCPSRYIFTAALSSFPFFFFSCLFKAADASASRRSRLFRTALRPSLSSSWARRVFALKCASRSSRMHRSARRARRASSSRRLLCGGGGSAARGTCDEDGIG